MNPADPVPHPPSSPQCHVGAAAHTRRGSASLVTAPVPKATIGAVKQFYGTEITAKGGFLQAHCAAPGKPGNALTEIPNKNNSDIKQKGKKNYREKGTGISPRKEKPGRPVALHHRPRQTAPWPQRLSPRGEEHHEVRSGADSVAELLGSVRVPGVFILLLRLRTDATTEQHGTQQPEADERGGHGPSESRAPILSAAAGAGLPAIRAPLP